jgi:hypothetical protein
VNITTDCECAGVVRIRRLGSRITGMDANVGQVAAKRTFEQRLLAVGQTVALHPIATDERRASGRRRALDRADLPGVGPCSGFIAARHARAILRVRARGPCW